MPTSSKTLTADAAAGRSGILLGLGAYVVWGFLPLYFLLLAPAGSVEIVASRILFSLVFCAIIITVTRRWPALVAIIRQPRLLFLLALAAVLILVNWQVYVYASVSGHVIEASLGYFMNPIVTILLGVFFLRERLRPVQWVAVGVSFVAVVILAVDYGSVPWISLTLAISFGLYGFVKNRVGGSVDALSGLTIETAWLVPIAIIALAVIGAGGSLSLFSDGSLHTVALAGAGIVTAVPLLLFASAARRLPLVYLGLIQYLTPVLQFILGATLLHESLPATRWIGFALVWVALVILGVQALGAARRGRPGTIKTVR